MQYILLAIILLQMALLVYMDIQNRMEREKLEKKIMSRDLNEYVQSEEKEAEPMTEEEDPYEQIEDVSVDKLMQAKDNR